MASSAAAQQAGFRACKRCHPDATPGSPEWTARADVVARAMRLIADGVVDRAGVPGLAGRLGYSVRQIQRLLLAEVGAGPVALARAQRAQTARLLIETTTLPMTDVAFAAGFGSVRTFNDTVRAVFARSPTALRLRAALGRQLAVPGMLTLKLPFRAPLCADSLLGPLAAGAVPGVEQCRDGTYRRTLRLPHGLGTVALRPGPDHVACDLQLHDLRDLATAISRCRRLLDLDADPVAVDEQLRGDPVLTTLIDWAPGRRVPSTVDPCELAVRTVLGDGVSPAVASRNAGRLVAAHGVPLHEPAAGLTHVFPAPAELAELDAAKLACPPDRRSRLAALVHALATGLIDLDVGSDWDRARHQLVEHAGVGRRAIETIAMRGLGDPDAFVPSDPAINLAARRLGLPSTPGALTRHASTWRPWRAYAAQYLAAGRSMPVRTATASSS